MRELGPCLREEGIQSRRLEGSRLQYMRAETIVQKSRKEGIAAASWRMLNGNLYRLMHGVITNHQAVEGMSEPDCTALHHSALRLLDLIRLHRHCTAIQDSLSAPSRDLYTANQPPQMTPCFFKSKYVRLSYTVPSSSSISSALSIAASSARPSYLSFSATVERGAFVSFSFSSLCAS